MQKPNIIFILDDDPSEQVNLWDERNDIVNQLKQILEDQSGTQFGPVPDS